MGMFLDSVAFYWPKDKTREELAPKLESFFEGYGLKLRMKDPTRESYAVYDENQSCSDVMPELIAALSECSWLIKKHNKTGQGQSAPPLFRARQIIG